MPQATARTSLVSFGMTPMAMGSSGNGSDLLLLIALGLVFIIGWLLFVWPSKRGPH